VDPHVVVANTARAASDPPKFLISSKLLKLATRESTGSLTHLALALLVLLLTCLNLLGCALSRFDGERSGRV
jgi:hypothetical protein